MFGATIHKGFDAKKIFMTVSIANVIVHEAYNDTNLENDIALIKLHIPLPLSKTNSKRREIHLTPNHSKYTHVFDSKF
jgi:secreted trypsin-like serine protease